MKFLNQLKFLLSITQTHEIMRRYFVVNGFDGALTMLGLMLGFMISGSQDIIIVINACLGAAIALGVSGVSSAYISEVAERRRALNELEEAMIKNLQQSAHGDAVRWVPLLVALVNGSAPLVISLIILAPLWLFNLGFMLPLAPIHMAIGVAFILIFLLGVFLGRISGVSIVKSGLQTLTIAALTVGLIFLFVG